MSDPGASGQTLTVKMNKPLPVSSTSPLGSALHAASTHFDLMRIAHDATPAFVDVWRALRASMRSVLEQTSVADVASGGLPGHVRALADDYRRQEEARGHSVG